MHSNARLLNVTGVAAIYEVPNFLELECRLSHQPDPVFRIS
jgi:hypothetical protein